MKKTVIAALLAAPAAMAHCPLCTAATGAAVVAARSYGINDGVVGLFVGAFAVSTGLWVSNFLKKRSIFFPNQPVALTLASVIITVASLYWGKLFANTGLLWGFPALLTGILFGSAASSAAFAAHTAIRQYNGKNFLPMQGIALVIVSLIISVLILGSAI